MFLLYLYKSSFHKLLFFFMFPDRRFCEILWILSCSVAIELWLACPDSSGVTHLYVLNFMQQTNLRIVIVIIVSWRKYAV